MPYKYQEGDGRCALEKPYLLKLVHDHYKATFSCSIDELLCHHDLADWFYYSFNEATGYDFEKHHVLWLLITARKDPALSTARNAT